MEKKKAVHYSTKKKMISGLCAFLLFGASISRGRGPSLVRELRHFLVPALLGATTPIVHKVNEALAI
jgi:hypothetical protein